MSVYEALSLMIAFATLIVLVNNNKDNKSKRWIGWWVYAK